MARARDPWPDHCRRRLAAAILRAADLDPGADEADNQSERVHAARKALKEARALAALMAAVLGGPARDAPRALDSALRRMGRARDLDVMPAALASLGAGIGAGVAAALHRAIERERAQPPAIDHATGEGDARVAQMRALARQAQGWDLSQSSARDIVRAVRGAWRQARRRGQNALESGEPRALHRLRERVVDLGHWLSALEPAWPAQIGALAHELHRLREHLGERNDLAVLAAFAQAQAEIAPEDARALAQAIAARAKRLTRRAERDFKRIFAERPQALADRIGAYLDDPKGRI